MNRRYDLDAVRVAAFGLLVLYHVGMYYVSWDWHVKSPHAGPTLEPLMLLTAPWRLSLLFLVSGAATAFLLARAPGGFLAARSWRLLLPLAFGMVVVVPPQAYYEVVEKLPGGYREGYLAFYGRYLSAYQGFCRDDDCLILPTWNHLWFVAYLWVYTLALVALLKALPSRARAALGRGRDRLLAGAGLLLWPALALGLARVLLIDHFGSTHALVDDLYNHAQYLPLFLLGFAVAHAAPFWAAVERGRWPALVLAAAAYAALLVYFALFRDAASPPALVRGAMHLAWGVMQWCAVVAILGFARRWVHGPSAAVRYLTPAVYPVYILHQTVIIVLAHHLKPLALAPVVEGPLLVLATFALCFGAYEAIRRVAPLRPLFGLPARTAPANAALATAR
ncbi:MAG TPA: acyltransferase family protein [Lysobacter sp.]|nr:acyltransferase family protein [Lysobacter sp.]